MSELHGIVRKIIFSSNDGRFCVFSMEESRTKEAVAVTIDGVSPLVGQNIVIRGCWKMHPRFGKQFHAEMLEAEEPRDAEGVRRFLASGMIAGIGPSMADRIVDYFGDKTMEIFRENIDALIDLPGIGKKTLEKIKDSYEKIAKMQELIMFLQSLGIPGKYAAEIRKLYGDQTEEVLQNDPYRMVSEVSGISFREVDRIALAKGISTDDSERIIYGINYILAEAARNGNTCFPEEDSFKKAASLLQIDPAKVAAAGEEAAESGEIPSLVYEGEKYLYLPYLYEAETESVYKIKQLLQVESLGSSKLAVERFEKENRILLAEQQRKAVEKAFESGILIITGGPGTGKTTLVRALIMAAEQHGLEVHLMAPTGRAAKRLSISSGRDADTIHKALEAEIHENGSTFFNKNESDLLKEDLIIVDESSMMDIPLFSHLLNALRDEARLILVGDMDQLPPIGPGNPLRDLLNSEVPVIRLDHIFRQAEGSQIVENAARVRNGEMCISDDEEFRIIYADTEEDALRDTLSLCRQAHYYEDREKMSMQVLSPMYRGICGVNHLNELLQKIFQGEEAADAGTRFLPGDKVMQKVNDYEKGVYNGDIGIVWAADRSSIKVHYYDKEVSYEGDERNNIQLAYAVTVHKSQGSEYNRVVFLLLPTQWMMLQRNLLYTGITRARKQTVLITTKSALQQAVQNQERGERNSLFGPLLKGEIEL